MASGPSDVANVSSAMRPAAARSPPARRTRSTESAGPETPRRRRRRASTPSPRSWPCARPRGPRRRRTRWRRRPWRRRARDDTGHAARCTVPSCHQRPDLFGHERQHRGEQPQLHREREGERGLRRRGRLRAAAAVGAVLDQLDVVVAERPEERLGELERAGVVVVVERGRGLVDDVGERARASRGRAGRVTTDVSLGRGAAPRPSTNLLALSSLIARRRPIFICPMSNAVSVPGRPRRRPVAHGVGAVLVEQVRAASRRCPWTCSSSCGPGRGSSR